MIKCIKTIQHNHFSKNSKDIEDIYVVTYGIWINVLYKLIDQETTKTTISNAFNKYEARLTEQSVDLCPDCCDYLTEYYDNSYEIYYKCENCDFEIRSRNIELSTWLNIHEDEDSYSINKVCAN